MDIASKQTLHRLTCNLYGASNIGKTSLVHALVHRVYKHDFMVTSGADFKYFKPSKTLTNPPVDHQVVVWDIGGKERFREIAQSYYRSCNCFVACYNVFCRASLTEAIRCIHDFWNLNGRAPVLLLGITGHESRRGAANSPHVTTEEGKTTAATLNQEWKTLFQSEGYTSTNVYFLEVSPATNQNLTEMQRIMSVLALWQRGDLDHAAVKYCLDQEYKHVTLDGVDPFQAQDFKDCCGVQQEIYFLFMLRRAEGGGEDEQEQNSLDKWVPNFLRRRILSFLPIFHSEDTWYDTEIWRKRSQEMCERKYLQRTDVEAMGESVDKAPPPVDENNCEMGRPSPPPPPQQVLKKKKQCIVC